MGDFMASCAMPPFITENCRARSAFDFEDEAESEVGVKYLDGDFTCHLYGTAETDLAIALGEVQIADRELGPGHQHGEEDLAATRQVLDVTITTMLGPARHGAGALLADLLGRGGVAGTDMYGLGFRRQRHVAALEMLDVRALGDQLTLAVVPDLEDFGGRRTAEDSRVDQAGEAYAGDVAGGAVDAFEVPDGLSSVMSSVGCEGAIAACGELYGLG